MAENTRRRNMLIALVVILIVIALLLTKCLPKKTVTPERIVTTALPASPATEASRSPAKSAPAATQPDEILTPATLTVPERVTAGAVFAIVWTGPDNDRDFITIVQPDDSANDYGNYRETKDGKSLELTAPIQAGKYEVRYVTSRSRTILGRATVEVIAAGATLDAPAEIALGAQVTVTWMGPNNKGDYVTIVSKDTPDGQFGNYTYTEKGSPLTVTAPVVAGDAEVRYVAGQGHKVLARRAIRIAMPEISITAPAEAIAGSTIQVTWTGPNNERDYITVVPDGTPEGQYQNYSYTSSGSPLNLLLPIMSGGAELRYMTGQGNKVLGRRAIKIVAAKVTLSAPPECVAGSDVSITWTGPNNPSDYITVVSKSTPDGQYAAYTITTNGSPLNVKAPKEPGDAEIRYMAGQGNKVLARIPIKVKP